jgi:hypothetical protein
MQTITCEAIDLRTSTPAVGLRVILRCTTPAEQAFQGIIDNDGQIRQWNHEGQDSLEEFLRSMPVECNEMWWLMEFFVGGYFQGASCFTVGAYSKVVEGRAKDIYLVTSSKVGF